MSLMELFTAQLQQECPELSVKYQEPLSGHTSFRIGGPAQCMVFPKTERELAAVLRMSKKLDSKPVMIGAGTNVLAPDEGLRGLVICTKDFRTDICRLNDTDFEISSGTTLARAAMYACEQSLTGLEFAQGIPGTVGGGIYMNAGAYGGEIKQVAFSTVFMQMDGTLQTFAGEEQEFSYRHSTFTQRDGLIVKSIFRLQPGNPENIREKMRELSEKRRASQPLELPSAGSTFKRPVGGYAAALIEQAGLKGFAVGGAAVSQKHAGFVVNTGGATAAQVLKLIEEIQQRVYRSSGIMLEPEVRILKQGSQYR